MRLSVAVLVPLLLSAASPAGAQKPARPQRLGLCAGCHGETGQAADRSVPNLAAQNLDYLRSALRQYRSGARDVPAMRAVTAMLGDAELDAIVQWYAAQPAEAPAQ
ncbi:MAG TPA: c-type cytochrome [Rudaea sp.]